MTKEIIDIFDCNYNHTGTAEKDEAHRKGLWHQTFHCWIVRPDNKIVLQLRSKGKENHPDRLDISVAGHISEGETVEGGGLRELSEELSLKADSSKLKSLGYFQVVSNVPSKKITPYIDTEFCNTFLYIDETPLREYTMQPDEVDAVFEIDIQEGLKLFSEEINQVEICGIERETGNEIIRTVSFKDFVPHPKSLWLKIFIMAERLLEGKKYLAV